MKKRLLWLGPALFVVFGLWVFSPSALGQEGYETRVYGRAPEEGSSVDDIDREYIERQGARDAAQAIEGITSVYASTGARGERTITLRGFGQRQIAVLIDGGPAYIPWDGQMDLAFVPAEAIERITVLKGPAALFFGPNGLGGALNIVTRRPGLGPYAALKLEVTGAGAGENLSGWHSSNTGGIGWSLYAGLNRRAAWPLSERFNPTPNERGGMRDNSDASMWHFGGALRAEVTEEQAISTSILYVDGHKGVPPSTVDPVPRYWRFPVWRLLAGTITHEATLGNLETHLTGTGRFFGNTLESYDDRFLMTQNSPRAFTSEYRDWTAGFRGRAKYRIDATPWGPMAFGSMLVAQYDHHGQKASGGAKPEGTHSRSLLTVTGEAESFFPSGFSLLLGCELDAEVPGSGQSPSRLAFGPLVSLGWAIPQASIRLTGAKRSRFPTLKERYSESFGLRVPNPQLGPESAWHMGLDSAWSPAKWISLEAGFFDAEVFDLIELVALGQGKDQFQNIGRARMLGADITTRLEPHPAISIKAGWAWLYARRSDGSRLAYRPSHKALAELVLWPLRWLEISTTARLVGPQSFEDPQTRQWRTLGAFVAWDARADFRLHPTTTVWLRVTNVLDAFWQSEYGFPDPGRQVWIGARIAFEGKKSAMKAQTQRFPERHAK